MELLVFLLGLSVGSFLNVFIDRLPRGESPLSGRSRCDHCKRTLRWFELIPVVSFLLQAGCCRRCHQRLSLQYPLIELGTGLGFWLIYRFGNVGSLGLIGSALLFSSFTVIAVADLKYHIIPDSMLAVATMGLFCLAFSPVLPVSFSNHPLSALGASVFFYTLFLVTHGRGMGFGDVKLAAVLGLWLGYPMIIIALYLAFLTGALVSVILILLKKKTLKSRIAFGPFLILGSLAALFLGDAIINWWIQYL